MWTGVEYQVAASLVYEGREDLALSIIEDVRARHDGRVRSPWSESEAGHHYTRSLASWALVPAYAGFVADLPNRRVEFAPRTEEFTTFWSHGAGWGTYEQSRNDEGELVARITVREGELGTDEPVTPADRVEVIANLPVG